MRTGMLSAGQRRVLTRFLLIGAGIPLLLLAVELAVYPSLRDEEMRLAASSRWLVLGGLALAGVGAWAFFAQLLYRRLMDILGGGSGSRDLWSFAEGAYGLIGVGISLSPAMAFFYFALSRDFAGSLVLQGLAWVLLAVELLRFLPRTDELEKLAREKGDGADQGF